VIASRPAAKATTTHTTAEQAPPRPTSSLTGLSTGCACSARRARLWTGHAELGELGVAWFALYLVHDRKESTLKAYGSVVLSPVY